MRFFVLVGTVFFGYMLLQGYFGFNQSGDAATAAK